MLPIVASLLALVAQIEVPGSSTLWEYWDAQPLPVVSTGDLGWGLNCPATAFAEDLNSDGRNDLIVVEAHYGLPSPNPASLVALDGRTMGELWRTSIGDGSHRVGSVVELAGDYDGDGNRDLLVGSPQAPASQLPGATPFYGVAHVVSSATGAVIRTHAGTTYGESLGYAFAPLDDLDGDSHFSHRSAYSTGSVSLHSAADGSILTRWTGNPGQGIGSELAVMSDGDGDGLADFATIDWLAPFNHAVFVWGASRTTPVSVLQYAGQGIGFASRIASIPDLSGDGMRDLIASAGNAPRTGLYAQGRVFLVDGVDGSILTEFAAPNMGPTGFGAGLTSGVAEADPETGLVRLLTQFGTSYDLRRYYLLEQNPGIQLTPSQVSVSLAPTLVEIEVDFPESEAGADYLVLFSSRTGPGSTMLGVSVPLGSSNLLTRYLLGSLAPLLSGSFGTLDATGDALATLLVPPGAAGYVGRELHVCAVSTQGLVGRRSTAARSLEIQP